jgi:hypothetical protein
MTTEPTLKSNGFLKKIGEHPFIILSGWIMGIVGVIGVCFTFYLYYSQKPNLAYYISPTRTAIVQKQNLNNFSVTYQGTPIAGDLSAVEIQIWNAGKTPIRGGDIVNGGDIERSITIKPTNSGLIYTIYEAQSRPEIGLSIPSVTTNQVGSFQCNWKILEQGDGIKLQIIYGGDVNLPFIVDGAIVGQKNITKYSQNNNKESFSILGIIRMISVWIIFAAVFVPFNKLWLFTKVKTKRPIIVDLVFLTVFTLLMGATMLSFIYFLSNPSISPPKPPFGF